MKKNLYTLVLTLMVVSLVCFFACNKNTSTEGSGTNPNNIPPEVTVTASLQGRVVDEKGVPVQGAAVSSGVATTTTDINGIFTFSKISMSSRFGFVKVAKAGYFTGSRSIITNGGASNYVSIQLIPRTSKGGFPASTGGTVVVQAGDTAAFPSAGVVNAATSATYTGNVHVYATYLDPTAPDLFKYMPGDLRGIGKDGKETALQSFGMLAVEMEGDAGEKLQLAAGKKATLTWAIPVSLQATAPATIPLWYFNDSTGRWIEEGSALRVGNSYVGQVGHFSYWNTDYPYASVNFKVQVKDQYGNPLAYTYIVFTIENNGGWAHGYTDSSGRLQGELPKGKMMLMQVQTECGNFIGGVNVGPALTDQDLGIITLNISDNELTLTGTVVDCTDNPLADGFVTAQVDGLSYRSIVKNGVFTLPINRCYSSNAPVTLTASDILTLQAGATSTINASSGTVAVGQLSACGNPYDQYIIFQANGTNYQWLNPPDQIQYSSYSRKDSTTGLTVIYNQIASNSASGTFSLNLTNLTGVGQYTAALNSSLQSQNNSIQGNVQLNISEFGQVGGSIVGTLSGNIEDQASGKSYPITGRINVTRTQ